MIQIALLILANVFALAAIALYAFVHVKCSVIDAEQRMAKAIEDLEKKTIERFQIMSQLIIPGESYTQSIEKHEIVRRIEDLEKSNDKLTSESNDAWTSRVEKSER